jgi:hypothetical protein
LVSPSPPLLWSCLVAVAHKRVDPLALAGNHYSLFDMMLGAEGQTLALGEELQHMPEDLHILLCRIQSLVHAVDNLSEDLDDTVIAVAAVDLH